ncbi:MAG TPA: lysylphosphatidylglycerol synthase transmembrane domain-containing protein [Tepidisphaeraceae bacterium]|nr:lysylphosphatidylglycerol synthase transmembrane domain-containing protein [Tepidisphaeraceae bacterium]
MAEQMGTGHPVGQAKIDATDHGAPARLWSFGDYFWFLFKNVVGWVLILIAFPVGFTVPGPGGLPLFVVGFALITFPGKRKLTARVLRGIPVRKESRAYRTTVAMVALAVPAGVISWLFNKWWPFFDEDTPRTLLLTLSYLGSVAFIWIFGLRGIHIINLGLYWISKARRRVRPWLRQHGLDLLPPRRRWRLRRPGIFSAPDEEILEIHERHQHRAKYIWRCAKPWLIRVVRVTAIVAIFGWMLRPVYRQWDVVGPRILAIDWWMFGVAAVMFSVFLFVFRATSWRWILIGFGHRLPVAAATRIWSMSELARYMPGVIWQVVGRVYLSRPYGVSGSISSASQVLELVIFMLANIVVAMAGLLGAGIRRIPPEHRHWIFIAMGFVPLLLILAHPKVFYGLMNRLMAKLNKPPVERALGKRKLMALLGWNILGLLWQSLAIWVLTYSVLGLPIGKWYVVAGVYCLAWTMGFSVGFLSPGGIGVRELVFVTMLRFMLPAQWVSQHFADPSLLPALAGFLGVLLRLWAMGGELLMAGVAYVADYRGAQGRPDAPGRVPLTGRVTGVEGAE